MSALPSIDWAHWAQLIAQPTRERLGLSRRQLARKAGVSADCIRHLELGRTRRPTLRFLRPLCNALDLPLPGDEGLYLSHDGVSADAMRRLVAAGTELRPFPRSVLEPCFLEAYKFYDELAAKDPKFKKIYDNLKAFRTDENLWFRVAENTFDNFNFSMSAQGR